MFLLLFSRWSYGIVLYEIFTKGKGFYHLDRKESLQLVDRERLFLLNNFCDSVHIFRTILLCTKSIMAIFEQPRNKKVGQ